MRASILFSLVILFIYLGPHPLLAASLELRQVDSEATRIAVLVGEEVEVELWVDSESRPMSGAAVFLSFDETLFELVDQDRVPVTAGFQPFAPGTFLSNGEIFRNELLPADDPAAAASGEQLDYSIVRASDQGTGSIATFRLKALAPSRESLVRIDESGIRETRFFQPDGSHAPFRFITPLRVVVQGITLSELPERLVLPRGALDETTFQLDDLIFDPIYPPEEITWTLSPTASLAISRDPSTNILSIAAPADESVWEQLIITATNPDGQSATDTVEIFVAAPPLLPAVAPPVTFPEDGEYELPLEDLVTDPDTPIAQLTWSAVGSPELTAVVEGPPHQMRLTPAADWSGQGWVELTVTDDFGFADSLRLPVSVEPINDPPRLRVAPNVRLTTGRADSSLVVADLIEDREDGLPELSWTGAGQIDIERRDGRLVLSNRDGWTGTEEIVLTVTDSGGLTDSAPLTVTVVPSLPPDVSGAPERRGMAAGDHFVLALDDLVVDPDDPDDLLSWSIDGQQQLRVLLSSGRAARVEAPVDFAGVENLTFTVTDPTGQIDTFDLLVFAAPSTGEPLISPLPELSVPVDGVDTSLDLDDYIYDLDHLNGSMEFFLPERGDIDLRVDPLTHVLTVSPTPEAVPGPVDLELRVVDPDGHEAFQTLRVQLTPSSQAPPFSFTLSALGEHGFDQDQTYTLDLDDFVSGDIDPALIAWSVEGQDRLIVTLDPDTHRLVLQAPGDWSGSETLTFAASYPDLPIQRQSATITVRPVAVEPLPTPQLSPFPLLSMEAGASDQSLDLDDFVSDADPASVSWTVDGQRHVSAVIDATTHRLLIIADEDWSGQEVLILTGLDELGNRLEGVLEIDIALPPPPLTISDVAEIPLFAGTAQLRIDPALLLTDDLDPTLLFWEASGNHIYTLLYDPTLQVLILTPDSPWQSSDIVTIRIRDGASNEATGHLLVQVLPTDGSVGLTSPDFQLAVLPNPLQPEYVSLYVVGPAELETPPLLRLRDGLWSDLPLEPLAEGLWQSSHVFSPGQRGNVQFLALTIDADRQVLKSDFSMNLAKLPVPGAKPTTAAATSTTLDIDDSTAPAAEPTAGANPGNHLRIR